MTPAIHKKIKAFCAKGDKLIESEDPEGALKQYGLALDLIPDPKRDHEAATWVYSAIGDVFFICGEHAEALKHLSEAVQCPDGLGNAFIHLRLGQAQFELGNKSKAADDLARAYMAAGEDIFEDEHPKYFEFIAKKMKL